MRNECPIPRNALWIRPILGRGIAALALIGFKFPSPPLRTIKGTSVGLEMTKLACKIGCMNRVLTREDRRNSAKCADEINPSPAERNAIIDDPNRWVSDTIAEHVTG